jgi:thiol-disulfide isomerase/thioredoxin
MLYRLLLVGALLMAFGGVALAAEAPVVSISKFGQLHRPLPFPFDEKRDADRDVAEGRTRAAASGKLLLIDLGGNWCADCRILVGVMDLPEVKAFVEAHYFVVNVDVGRMNRNRQIPAHYGFTKRFKAVPVLLVVDPATDRLVNRDDVDGLVDARLSTPQALADWLARWVPSSR